MTDPVDDTTAPRRRWPLLAGAGALVVAGVAIGIWALLPPGTPSTAPATSPTPSVSSPSAPASSDPADAAATPDGPAATEEPDAVEENTDAPPPAPTGPVVSSFTVDTESVSCTDERADPVPLSFSWSSTDGSRAWIAAATNDASAAPFAEVPLASSGYADLAYDCRDPEQLFTLTVEGADGKTSASLSVTRLLG